MSSSRPPMTAEFDCTAHPRDGASNRSSDRAPTDSTSHAPDGYRPSNGHPVTAPDSETPPATVVHWRAFHRSNKSAEGARPPRQKMRTPFQKEMKLRKRCARAARAGLRKRPQSE